MKQTLTNVLLVIFIILTILFTLAMRIDMMEKHHSTPTPAPIATVEPTPELTVVPPLYSLPIDNKGE